MNEPMSPARSTPISFLKHATDVASFYGFKPVREIEREHASALSLKPLGKRSARGVYSFSATAMVCTARAAARPQDPVLAFYATPAPGYLPGTLSSREVGEFGMQVIGTAESMGEIMLLKILTMIAAEWGTPAARVRVNALGDKDSQQRFLRELSAHVRKHADELEESERDAVLTDPLALYRLYTPAAREIIENAPRSIHFLSEKSRVHFRCVLEHLEHLGLPWEIDHVLASDARGPHVSFALDFADPDAGAPIVAAEGGRFDEYLKRESRRKDSVGVGASIFFRKKGATRANFSVTPPARKPKIYFAQLGLRAKLQGLTVLDMLRTAQVPVAQSFDASHLSSQLANAAQVGVSHLLIMGQREALDGTIIVRSTKNSSQTIMAIREVPRFLKTLSRH